MFGETEKMLTFASQNKTDNTEEMFRLADKMLATVKQNNNFNQQNQNNNQVLACALCPSTSRTDID